MITALALVSLSDFILGLVCIFMAGNLFGSLDQHFSRYGMATYFLLFAGLAAFMGGIDHGFFEPIHQRYYPRTLSYIMVALATFMLFNYAIKTYVKRSFQNVLHTVSVLQLIAFCVASFYIHNFLLVVGNYAPVLLLFFILNTLHHKKSKSAWYFMWFSIILIIATLIQVFDLGLTQRVNGDTLFHIVAIIAYLFYFKGSKQIPKIITEEL